MHAATVCGGIIPAEPYKTLHDWQQHFTAESPHHNLQCGPGRTACRAACRHCPS